MMRFASSAVSGLFRIVSHPRDRLLILIYHRVRPWADNLMPQYPTAATFSWQMDLLARYMRPLSLSEALPALIQGSLPPRAVAVSFDDGYRDNFEVAAPILRQYGVPATFFVATGYLDNGRMWNDTVIESIRALPAGRHMLPSMDEGGVEVEDDEDRRKVCRSIIDRVKYLRPDLRQQAVEALEDRCGRQLPADLMMTRSQVSELARSGFDIGAHTVSHPILRNLPIEDAADEIARSKSTLETLTGARVRHFAYPNGKVNEDYDDRHATIARRLGFDAAVTTIRGVCSPASDPHQLPRFTPWDRTPDRFLARMLLEFRG